ncbi:4406_t:CDS:2 [Acaulospora morrowiae]|uniref:4406_t:CDS:1 n=1 Tax=Acaulospora morrowiae TaxID=94023 RepID=A0A9N9AB75_9GLOM|nr:4406_t:CDS:2 [Acaulospora morrowiae]
MVKSCNPSMKRQDLMDAANKEWCKYQKESEATIKNQINQYLIASPSIVRTTAFFLPPNSLDLPSSELSTSNSAGSKLLVSDSSSLLLNKTPIAPNAPAQRKSLMLIQEAEAKITKYEHLLINTSDKDLRYEIAISLNNISTQQIQLSNVAFIEDFSNLSSTNSSYSSKVFDLRDTLSDTE